MDQQSLLLVLVVVAIAVMIFFSIRNNRKRQRDAADMQQKLQPGVEVMTSHGIYGTLISLDEDKNEAIIETTPGTRLRLHRQTITRVVEPELAEAVEGRDETANARLDAATTDDVVTEEPEYGERADVRDDLASDDVTRDTATGPEAPVATEPEKATPRGRKKTGE